MSARPALPCPCPAQTDRQTDRHYSFNILDSSEGTYLGGKTIAYIAKLTSHLF